MIYHGKEKENHRGSHVRYCSGNKWFEGTLLEPVNYQIIITKEHGPVILSCHTPANVSGDEARKAAYAVAFGRYDNSDLGTLQRFIDQERSGSCKVSEVESVTITDANDISEEEAKALIDEYIKKMKDPA